MAHGPVVICPLCNEWLCSMHRHDYQQCSCENMLSVDGGPDYIRMGGLILVEGVGYIFIGEGDYDEQD